MPQQVTTASFTTAVPGAYVDLQVAKANAGFSTTGVLMLVGEANQGPDYTLEADITTNSFGPDGLTAVVAKYKSGPIVDAFRIAASASSDPSIQGGPNRIFVAKTNVSVKATTALVRQGLTAYATIADRSFGDLGNLINTTVSAFTSEVAPTTGAFTLIPSPTAATLAFRVNGQAQQSISVAAFTSPAALVGSVTSASNTTLNSSVLAGLNTLNATGGVNRNVITGFGGGNTLAVAATGASVVITLGTGTLTAWATIPVVGDTLLIPASGEYGAGANSVIVGTSTVNAGAYVVTGATTTTVTATKLRHYLTGALVNPVNVAAVVIVSVTNDLQVYSPIIVNNASGTNRSLVTAGLVGQTITGTATGSTLVLTLGTGNNWPAVPQAGDLLLMPSTAPAGFTPATNGGWYSVVSATTGLTAGASTVTLTRLSNGLPASFGATVLVATTDLQLFRPAIDGAGKALEIYDGGGVENISLQLYTTAGVFVTFLSTSTVPNLLTSTTEYSVQLTNNRSFDNIAEVVTAGGDIVLSLGYNGGGASGVSGTANIANVNGIPTLTTTVVGGNGSNLTVNLARYKTINDLVTFLSTQTGYTCVVSSTLFGQQLTTYFDNVGNTQTVLDRVTLNIASQLGASPGRWKRDAWRLFQRLSTSVISMLNPTNVTLGPPVITAAAAGLPDVQSITFYSGGAKGGTSNAQVTGALLALEKVKGNFLIPLFSQDSTTDITFAFTDPSSTYTIDAINAACKTHVLALSQIKRRRNRQALVAKRTSFTNAKLASTNLASQRVSMVFQDFKFLDSSGNIVQFGPHMGAVAAASMQAAGFYKGVVKKFINTSGILMNDGSFSDQILTQVEDSLQNGLMPAERADSGGFRWISDQTTYSVDTNFVYNSLQAMYVADTIALTMATRLENMFVGQSVADVSAGIFLSAITVIMSDFKKLKLIAASDDAPLGFKNVTVQISGPSALVSLEVKLAGLIYFIPITALVTPAIQTASF